MRNRIYRSVRKPIRDNPSFEERWRGPDKGLIMCWEVGRKKGNDDPVLAELAKRGELPVLYWKGGIEKKILKTEKYGTLNYLAEWQGLKGEDLDIDMSQEIEIVCSKTGMKVVFTGDAAKFSEP